MEFITIRPAYIRRCVGGTQGWGGWWQRLTSLRKQDDTIVEFRVAMMCTCTHKGQYSTTMSIQTCTDSGSHIRSSLPNWSPPLKPVMDLHGRQNHYGKAEQLTLPSGSNEHANLFSVAISWGNKMNFSLYASMLSFCSDSHIATV